MKIIRNFSELISKVGKFETKTIAVAVAQDQDVLLSLENTRKLGLANAILVGDKAAICDIAKDVGIDTSNYTIEDVPAEDEACHAAVELVCNGKASLLMKGFVETSTILKAVLDKERGLRSSDLITHVGLLKVKGFDRMFILSDSAMTIAPTLEEKAAIINNAVSVAHALGIKIPKVAVLCASEKVSIKMPATIDADKLTKMNENGEIKGCIVKGPLALDNAVSPEAAKHKGIDHPVAGYADILITPDIEAGNILNKSMEYFAKAEKAGVLIGAKTPIILTSRASSDRSKLHSIVLGILVAAALEKGEI